MTLRPNRIRQLQSAVAPALALLAGMELGLFTHLASRSVSASVLAAELGVAEDRLARLLDALVVAGVLEFDRGSYRNGAEANVFLAEGSPADISGEHELLRLLWEADLKTAASIRSGRPEAEHNFGQQDDETAAAFQRGLLPSTRDFGRELADAIDVPASGAVLDVGGGPAGALLSLAARYPDLQLTLLELPAVARVVRPMLAGTEPSSRIRVEEANIVAAPSSSLHDLVILKAVVQVLSAAEAAMAIRHCFMSLKPGGSIVIGGAGMLDDTLRSPAAAVFYNLTFMNLYREGRSYPRASYLAWLAEAGFVRPRFVTLASGSTILCAEKP